MAANLKFKRAKFINLWRLSNILFINICYIDLKKAKALELFKKTNNRCLKLSYFTFWRARSRLYYIFNEIVVKYKSRAQTKPISIYFEYWLKQVLILFILFY